MKERKEKDLRLKEKPLSFQPSGAVRDAGRVVRLMKDRCQRERGREQQEREPGAAASAAEQVEDYAADAISAASSVVGKGAGQIYRVMRRHRQAEPGEETGQEPDAAPPPPPSEAMQQAAVQEMGESVRTGGTEPDTEARPSVPAREKPSFVPREKQLPIRERPAREYRENIQSISVPHFSGVRAETEPVSSAPSPGERMKQAAIREQKKRALRGAAQPEPQSASAADMPSFPSEVFPDAPRRVPPGSPAPERLAAETRAPADRPFPIPRQGPRTPTEPGRSAAALRERPACPVPAIKTRQAAERTKLTGTAAVSKAEAASGTGPKAANRVRAVGGAAKPAVSRATLSRARQLAVDRTKQAARTTANLGKRAAQAVAHTASSLVSALAGLIGGGALLLILCGVLLVGAVIASPFGIFFSGEDADQTIRTAMEEINADYQERLDAIKAAHTYDVLEMSGSRALWKEVLAVYAVKTTTDPDQAQNVATMDSEKLDLLKDIFWQMHEVTFSTEERTELVVEETDDGAGGIVETETSVTRTYLHITVSHKTPDEMADMYAFDQDQRDMLAELLDDENNRLWLQALYGITEGDGDLVAIALSQVGNVGGEPYWSWYGFSSHVDWCACFVSWCANECGYIEAGVIPRFAGCILGSNWFKSRGLWQDGGYEPRAGDIIFFDWEGDGLTDHVGIVERVEGSRIYTVEGNSGDACRRNSYPIGSPVIYGFGCPAY